MKKYLAVTLGVLLTGCTSVKIRGSSLYDSSTDNGFKSLVNLLDTGVKTGGIQTKNAKRVLGADPQQQIIDNQNEYWHFEHSKTEGSIRLGFLDFQRQEISEVQELELVFDKTGSLTAYKLKVAPPTKSAEKTRYGFSLVQGILIGGSAAAAFKFIK